MNLEPRTLNPEHPTEYIEDEINLLDLVLVLLKRKGLIITIVLVAIATSLVSGFPASALQHAL